MSSERVCTACGSCGVDGGFFGWPQRWVPTTGLCSSVGCPLPDCAAVAEIREWIAGQYGVTYTEGGAYSLMRRLQCSPKVPRPLHAKADEEQQASWKKGGLDLRLHRPG